MSIANTHYGRERIAQMLTECNNIFFIGIGGINMSSLAELSKRRGYGVGGSDRVRSELCERLEGKGIELFYRHSGDNLRGYDAVVYTVAISEDNEEYVEARRKGLPLISRADYMGYLMSGYKRRVGISGMHGKSTCTSMCAKVFMDAGVSPTVLSGAELSEMGGAYVLGEGEDIIFEACEYMDSFLDFCPNISVILNIEMDHVDYFHSIEQIRGSYRRFADIALPSGVAVANFDDENVRMALDGYEGEVIGFGIDSDDARVRAENISSQNGRYSFDLIFDRESKGRISLSVSGRHNIYNALACATVAHYCGISMTDIKKGIKDFSGAHRRMEYKGQIRGADIYDDYGHHPTEIAATLEGARGMTEGRLFCVYQPHTYSRTASLFDSFVASFEKADRVIFADIYAAREKNVYGVSSAALAESVGDRAVFAESFERISEILKSELEEGDVAIIMGAGDIYKVFDTLDL